MNVEWRQVVEFPDYEISNVGEIRRLVESRSGGRKAGIIKKTQIGDRGYPRAVLYRGKYHRNCDIHTLVLTTFVRPRAPREEPHHKDGVKTNNTLPNLEWVTASENIRQNYVIGLRGPTELKGEQIGTSRFKDGEIYLIKRLLVGNLPQTTIAKMFRTRQSFISSIKTGRSWKHIGCPGFVPSKIGRPKEGEVYLIKKLLASGKFTNKFIGHMFLIDGSKVSQIKYGKRWASLIYP